MCTLPTTCNLPASEIVAIDQDNSIGVLEELRRLNLSPRRPYHVIEIAEMEDEKHILTANPRPGVRVITFNRPQKRNALSQALIDDFLQQLSIASKDAGVRALVITGSSSCFSGQISPSSDRFLLRHA